jgi:hypothetical protein
MNQPELYLGEYAQQINGVSEVGRPSDPFTQIPSSSSTEEFNSALTTTRTFPTGENDPGDDVMSSD